jgi:hypothetical protein
MDVDYTEIYKNFNVNLGFGGGLLKLLIILILVIVLFYSFMLLLKVRVLQDTVELSPTNFTKILLMVNLLVTLIGSLLSFLLILV